MSATSLAAPFSEPKEQKAASISIGSLAPVHTAPARVEPTVADSLQSTPRGRSMVETPVPSPFVGRVDKLHVVLASMHGLVRGTNMELGKDSDTGGQVWMSCNVAPVKCDGCSSKPPAMLQVDVPVNLSDKPPVRLPKEPF